MLTAQQREVAETAFDRNKRREAEISEAGAGAPPGSGQKHAPLAGAAFGARYKRRKRRSQAEGETVKRSRGETCKRVTLTLLPVGLTRINRATVLPCHPDLRQWPLRRRPINVRFTPESGHCGARLACPLCAINRHFRPMDCCSVRLSL